jgi:hypothetical protein
MLRSISGGGDKGGQGWLQSAAYPFRVPAFLRRPRACDTVRMKRLDRRLLHLALLDASLFFVASSRERQSPLWFGHGPLRPAWFARLLEGVERAQRFAIAAFLVTIGAAGALYQARRDTWRMLAALALTLLAVIVILGDLYLRLVQLRRRATT